MRPQLEIHVQWRSLISSIDMFNIQTSSRWLTSKPTVWFSLPNTSLFIGQSSEIIKRTPLYRRVHAVSEINKLWVGRCFYDRINLFVFEEPFAASTVDGRPPTVQSQRTVESDCGGAQREEKIYD